MKESLKVFLVCLFGAVIGGLFSYTALPTWWSLAIGCAVGFVVGYIGYDVRGALNGIKEAYRKVKGWKPTELENARILTFAMMCLSCFLPVILIFISGTEMNYTVTNLCLLWFFGVTFSEITLKRQPDDEAERLALWRHNMNPYAVYLKMPIVVLFQVFKWLPTGIMQVLRFIKNFALAFIKLIHSSERVVCGFDAMIGVIVAFSMRETVLPHSPFALLIGGVFGGIIGMAHVALARSIDKAFREGWEKGLKKVRERR